MILSTYSIMLYELTTLHGVLFWSKVIQYWLEVNSIGHRSAVLLWEVKPDNFACKRILSS